jgi:hypothetical protein
MCYKSTNTHALEFWEFYGPDCSQKSCPKGISLSTIATQKPWHANVTFLPVTAAGDSFDFLVFDVNPEERSNLDFDVQIDMRVISAGASPQLGWKFSSDRAFGNPVTISDHTTLTESVLLSRNGKNTGIRVWFDEDKGVATGATFANNVKKNDRYKLMLPYNNGITFNAGDANTAHQYTQCSGVGVCETSSGACQCPPGFSGIACQRRECPSKCSGHGVCTPLQKFVGDLDSPSYTYNTAWDATSSATCVCDAGFRGIDCSERECPSSSDPMGGFGADGVDDESQTGPSMDCSGRGVCDYSSGQCKCGKGFKGTACEEQTNFV